MNEKALKKFKAFSSCYNKSMTILTDQLFLLYGGDFLTSEPTQREIAYEIAEQKIAQHLATFLSRQVVTGTFVQSRQGLISLPHNYVRDANLTVGIYNDIYGNEQYATGSAYVQSVEYGVVKILYDSFSPAHCGGCYTYQRVLYPSRYHVVYTAGLDDFDSDKSAMLALKIQAQIALEQIVMPEASEGGAGDPGVQSWKSQGHEEVRTRLMRTSFGTSALDNYSERLLRHLRRKGAGRL